MSDLVAKFDADLFHIAQPFIYKGLHKDYFKGVFIEPHHTKGVLLVATDGPRLLVIYDETGYAKNGVIVRLEKSPLSLCKKQKSDKSSRTIEVMEDGTAFVLLGDTRIGIGLNSIVDTTFPYWRRAVPSGAQEQAECIGVNGALLSSFAQVSERLTGSSKIIFSGKAKKGFIVNFDNCENAFGVILPMLFDERFSKLPEFMKDASDDAVEAA